ncbi:MAG: pseudouridine synthase family protein [Candidatus Methanofastidiosia archaeon]
MIALRIAYDGLQFSGSQRQPEKRTVEGELLRAFEEIGAFEDNELLFFRLASRTDTGVSARENIAFFQGNMKSLKKRGNITRLNNMLHDIWVTAYATSEYKPPYEKEYLYFLANRGYDQMLVNKLCTLFSGRHDFSSFSKYNPKKDPVREISLSVDINPEYAVLHFVGKGFLWQMCRRVASAFMLCLENRISIKDLEEMLKRPVKTKIPPAPSNRLILHNIKTKIDYIPNPEGIKKMEKYFCLKACYAMLDFHFYSSF